jgi:hypothetical protein
LIALRNTCFIGENGQFKTSYREDQQIFPIAQDRVFIALLLIVAFVGVPLFTSDYMFRAILIPFVIMSMAALGVNILVGYCGQISLGSGAFMAVGAYGAYNFFARVPDMPLIPALLSGGLCATAVRRVVWFAEFAGQRFVFGGGHIGRTIFCRLDVFAREVVYLRHTFWLGVCV